MGYNPQLSLDTPPKNAWIDYIMLSFWEACFFSGGETGAFRVT